MQNLSYLFCCLETIFYWHAMIHQDKFKIAMSAVILFDVITDDVDSFFSTVCCDTKLVCVDSTRNTEDDKQSLNVEFLIIDDKNHLLCIFFSRLFIEEHFHFSI